MPLYDVIASRSVRYGWKNLTWVGSLLLEMIQDALGHTYDMEAIQDGTKMG